MRIPLFICVLAISDSVLRFVLVVLRLVRPAPRELPDAGGTQRCVILIAARDETGTIGPTVAALREHLPEWPGGSLWVIADRCADGTAEEAAAAGAQVAFRAAGQDGKGAVLAWWLQHHPAAWRADDCLIVLDADSRLAAGSLTALRRAMAAGAEAAQSFVAPLAHGGTGRLAGWSEVLMQRLDDEARRRCGWSVPLRGTGMALRAGLLAELAPRLHTQAEDLELDVLLAARGVRVAFVPAARIFDPKPQQATGAARQRARWLQGQWQVVRDYPREIAGALRRGGWSARLSAWLLLWLLLLRPKTAFIALRLLLLVIGYWQIALTGLALDGLYYLSGVGIVDDRRRYLRDLISAPRYISMWIYSFGLALVRRGWLRAGR